ncbi:hypothetical protein F4781DRAFT_185147 [Annulohypoxylon bovei var. microspora]|nr:hypothetical protein F4781DRAFT_185147 [Annulohypoxylon bovei var. microspora]
MLATPLSLIDTSASSTTDDSTSGSSTGDAATSSSTTTSDSTAESSTSTASSSSSTTTNSSSNSSSSSGTPVGAIVGGVVGGVAVIAFVILGIFFIKKYQRGVSATASPPPVPSGPQELPGSGTHSPYPPLAQYDATGQPKYQVPMTEAPPLYEAPNTPAAGTGYNRAELM